jgi:hypothetical protein
MSEYQQDPSASTGRFRAFVEGGEEEAPRARSSSVSPAVLIIGAVVIIAIVAIIIAMVA